ncbi:MAG TPA: MFS transporter [Candidatus Limnocylindrales bacterium]|nr:MFS transporter [Candidatus Limnocylindrales bacterium]
MTFRSNVPGLRGIGRFHRDARIFLVTTFVAGAALSLYWIDFNLYLASLGLPTSTIGVVSTIASVAGAVVAFPASALSDRLGRRAMMAGGVVIAIVALVGLLLSAALPLIVAFAALWSVGQQSLQVVQAPFLTEHSEPEHRNELFAIQFAIQNVTNVAAAILGGIGAAAIAGWIGLDPDGPGTYRVILVIMAILLTASLAFIALLTDDRPRVVTGRRMAGTGEPAAFPPDPRRSRARFGLVVVDRGRFARLLVPGLLISIGAGQVIPFLNVFIQRKFGLDLASLNGVFAFTSLGTVAAILAQPRLARRFGQITSVVIVQGASIPFLVVLGFSPVLWMVILAMAVRNSLMNAGNPIFSAFAMEQVAPRERATLAAAMSVLWQVGWVVGGLWYALLQASLGFDAGYAVNFATIITLYTIATALYWVWFRRTDRERVTAAPGVVGIRGRR